jgi:hypothetical protein
MAHWRFWRRAGLTAAAIGLGAGLTVGATGCGGSGTASPAPNSGGGEGVLATVPVPPLDAIAPSSFETATFALG